MTELLIGETTLDSILQLVSELAERTLPAADGVSVTLNKNGKLLTAAHSKEFAKKIDEMQYQHRDGPCVTAIRTGDEVHSFPFDFSRWPNLQAVAEDNGVGGVYSLPLKVHPDPLGALNVYSTQTTGPSDAQVHLARLFAKQSSILLANATAYADAQAHVDQLKEGLRSREVIGQAKGILMQRERCSADAAFDMLRQISMRTNIKLRDVAQRIVDSVETPGGPDIP
ncbi:MAG: ANTAR domain-containing protein [Actinomycetota bacterium]